MAKFIVGLTGGIGCGKSTVTHLFKTHHIDIVDADLIAKMLVEPGRPALAQIINRFGNAILLPDGQLDRKQLRQLVFDHPNQRKWLNSLLHPLIHQQISQQLASATTQYVILDAPLLLENKLNSLVNRVLVVDCLPAQQLIRGAHRDKLSQQAIKAIIRAQLPREKRLAYADDIIDNSGPPDALAPQVQTLHNLYSTLSTAPD